MLASFAANGILLRGRSAIFFSLDTIWAELDRPLIPDHFRLEEIKWQLLPYLDLLTERDHETFEEIAKSQLAVEKDLERALRYKGYTAASLLSNRTNIRSSVFYPTGKVLSVDAYLLYRTEMQVDLQTAI